ncbi:MAG: threonine--tRNA ligase, partial [Negativicutes bacterium]|nr:threonine--tRNA ligase [Negativicutes bacterium]
MSTVKICVNQKLQWSADGGITPLQLLRQQQFAQFRLAVAVMVNGRPADWRQTLDDGDQLEYLDFDTEYGRKAFWHSAAHIMAQALKRIYPGCQLAIGPAVDNGFYYDVDLPDKLTNECLAGIEREMQNIVRENLPIVRETVDRQSAIRLFSQLGEPYKLELIGELPENSDIFLYRQGEFVDLCAGPHVPYTGRIKAFRLLSIAGAYWRGDAKNKMLQRIYGIAMPEKAALDAYLQRLAEARARDHNKIGRELEYFTTVPAIGQGLPLLMPNGAKVVQLLQRFIEDEEERRGYLLTKTPLMAKSDLYKISGHWDYYQQGMFVIPDPAGPPADG